MEFLGVTFTINGNEGSVGGSSSGITNNFCSFISRAKILSYQFLSNPSLSGIFNPITVEKRLVGSLLASVGVP
jgi:hypothetical protein